MAKKSNLNKTKSTTTSSSTHRQRPMSGPGGFSGGRKRYGDGGKVK